MMTIKEYLISLTDNYSNQIYHELKDFGLEVTWLSNAFPHLIAAKTDKDIEELKKFHLIKRVQENESYKVI